MNKKKKILVNKLDLKKVSRDGMSRCQTARVMR